jgi:hypothetical protein
LAYEQCADNPQAHVYIPGQRMLPQKVYEHLRLEMKILHDKIVESELANNKQGSIVNPTHYTAKVPKGYTFFEKFSGDKIYVDFKEIFYMFRFYSLETCLMRLWALFQATEVRSKNISDVAIADPYLMNEENLKNEEGRRCMKSYLLDFMQQNKLKNFLLVPYRPMYVLLWLHAFTFVPFLHIYVVTSQNL